MLTGKGLAEYSASKLGDAYMYGVNGLTITEPLIQAKAKQYPNMYTPTYIMKCRRNIGRRGWDCSSFSDTYTGVDKSANGWLDAASVKGPIATMPEIIGLEVHKDGHMGTYIGNGKVVEARGIDYGVVLTTVVGRPWTHWCYNPFLNYSEGESAMWKLGDTGNDVKAWQKSLIEQGNPLPLWGADGDFGKETETATGDFQVSVSLPRTGVADDVTVGKMLDKLIVQTNASKAVAVSLQKECDELKAENANLSALNKKVVAEYVELDTKVANWKNATAELNGV